ncbi:TrlF family AAA-like ATPase [Myroides indicus]|uniref:Putative AbiEii toxin of type IV toxin-antitoxin system n=1 Tax=Myroides indicus TaxID=1323422 RepID=A0A4R7EYR7_9FLAO|nr:AAA family ATPase [Myroides indicus]TDS59626.1 putative AbiEii toxin of type IV toxin-antitoxin system [Myroides indicus]
MIDKGSEWNIWDLHVHTPDSIFHRYGNSEDVWEKYITDLEKLPPQFKVIGVNDYFFLDGYKRLLKEQQENNRLQNLLLIPVLEFRIEKFAGVEFKNIKRINFHVIFSPDLPIDTIESQFLNTLHQSYTLEADGKAWTRAITKESVAELGQLIKKAVPDDQINKYGSDLSEGFNNLNLKESQIFESLKKDCFDNKYLIAIGKTEWDELKWSDASIAQKKSIINEANIVFTASENTAKYNAAKQKLTSQGVNDFLFDCSDAHSFSSETTEKDRIGNCLNWLKSDISFDGLRQVIIEKEGRLFIGDKPEVTERINTNRTKYIDSIKVNSVAGYDPKTQGEWFNNIEIPLNPELVAIIGNKGNGKSALADIIGLCGDYCGSHDDFSFLNKKRFGENNGRKSSNFEATLTWKSGNSVIKNLNDKVAESVSEKVKYLPQGYFERLTNNHDSIEDFNREIENVVFTHLEVSDKLGKNTFQQLIDFKTLVTEEEILGLKNKLQAINKSLFEKEKKLNPEYKKSIENQIEIKENELKALMEPDVVPNPNDDPEHAKNNIVINQKLFELNQKIEDETKLLISTTDNKSNLLIEINNLKTTKQKIENKLKEFEFFKIEIKDELLKYGLDINTILTITSNLESINGLLTVKDDEYTKIKVLLGEENSDNSNFRTIPQKISELKLQQERIQNDLGEADKIYQNYLIDKKQWEENKSKIIGNVTTSGSLEFFKNELKYINEILESEIQTERKLRIEVTKEIFELKESVLGIYKNVKQKIDKIIEENAYLLAAYPIQVEASFVLKSNFQKKFLEYISLNKIGTFYGKENAELQLKKILEQSSLDTFDNISDLLKSITNALFVDLRDANNQSTNIENQVSDVVELYDYLFSLDFVDYNYELRQGNKSLNQLSPGEKGALLLIFYLLLDNNDIPLIIDQPEDNLDNHSVANILVPFIKKAKAKRQIILVTHNPNLAVVADAEQVIFTELDKENNYKFSFKAGAIENPVINDCIVKVLEGAMPAFNKRKLKYYESI